jgi:hypothetical protein
MTTPFFGQFLLERGRVSREQLLEAVRLQGEVNVKLGTLAMDRGLLSHEDVERLHLRQRSVDRRFGELAVAEGLLTQAQVDELLSIQQQERVLLGEALVRQGHLTLEQLQVELEAYRGLSEELPASLASIYKGVPGARILEVCTEITLKMFVRLVDEHVKPGRCRTTAASARLHDVSVHQTFTGELDGLYCLNLTEEMMRRMAACILEEEEPIPDEDALDGAREFVNIVAGNICARAGSWAWRPLTPTTTGAVALTCSSTCRWARGSR